MIIAVPPPPAPVTRPSRTATARRSSRTGFSSRRSEAQIQAGDTIVWRNTGGAHNVVFDDGSYRSGDPENLPLTMGLRTFAEEGTYLYHCEVHGSAGGFGMHGRVIVGKAAPDVTLTDVVLKRRIRKGRLRGSAKVAPAGTTLTVRVRFRHADAGDGERDVG